MMANSAIPLNPPTINNGITHPDVIVTPCSSWEEVRWLDVWLEVGIAVGTGVGGECTVGTGVGAIVGPSVGENVGDIVGATVGAIVGGGVVGEINAANALCVAATPTTPDPGVVTLTGAVPPLEAPPQAETDRSPFNAANAV